MPIISTIIVALVVSAISLVLSELLKPKPNLQNAKPGGIGDFKFPTAIEGRPVPIVWGTVQQAGPNVVWWGDLEAVKIQEKIKTGLFSSKKITTGFRYFVGVQMALCRGPIDAVTKIWIGDKLAFDNGSFTFGTLNIDEPNLFGGVKFGTGGIQGDVSITQGNETDSDNTYLSTVQSPTTPYRGTSFAVLEKGYIGTSTSIKPWKFEIQRFPNQLGLAGGIEKVNTFDANPAAVLYEILTDTDWGFGFSVSKVDVANFQAAATTLESEGNGFSMLLDREIEANELLELLQEQIGGVVFLDMATGQYKIKLARDDYDINTVPELDPSNVVEIRDFSRGTWNETSNQVRIGYTDRSKDYFESFAISSDIANRLIQDSEVVTTTQKYPGVKDAALTAQIAGRELQELSVPVARATVVVDRTLYELKPLDAVAFTEPNLGFTKLPMRVMRINYGSLDSGTIELGLVQDRFKFSAAFFGTPDVSLWTPPETTVVAPPADEQLVFESPYAISRRDPEFPELFDRVWCGLRRQGAEITFKIHQRSAAGAPSGSYIEDSDDIPEFMLMGELTSDLALGDAEGSATIAIDPDPDTVANLEDAFTASPSSADIGQNLVNLCMIGSDPATAEFIGVTSVTDQTTYLDLENVWRGMLDTAPRAHTAGTPVYLIFAGGDLNQSAFNRGYNVDVQLRGLSMTDELAEGSAVTTSLTLNDRNRRPYPPTQMEINGSAYPATVDVDTLKSGGSTLDERGLDVGFTRRDWRTYDEVEGIGTDAGSLAGDFPTNNGTEYQVEATAVVGVDRLLQGIKAHWKLEEASGDRVDATPLGEDLTPTGTPGNTTGVVGNALSLSGTGEFLEHASGSFANFDESFHLAAWVNLDAKSSNRCIVSKWKENTNDREYLLEYDSGSDRFRFAVSNDGNSGGSITVLTADSLGSPSTGVWYFVQAWWDDVNETMCIKVDDGKVDSTTHSGGVYAGGVAQFRVGAIVNGAGADDRLLDGAIDAVTVFCRVLEDTEQLVLWNEGNGAEYPFGAVDSPEFSLNLGLEAYFAHEEGTSAARVDSSIHGISLSNTSGVQGVTGKVNNASEFEESFSRFLEAGNNDDLQLGDVGDFTIATWCKLESKGSNRAVVSKWNALGSKLSYTLFYATADDRMRFQISDDGTIPGTVFVNADSFGSPPLDTWMFIVCKHEEGVGLTIQVDNGTIDSTAHTLGVASVAEPYRIGTLLDGAGNKVAFWDGTIDETGHWSRLLSTDEITSLWNSGNGETMPFAEGEFCASAGPDVTEGYEDGPTVFVSRTKLLRELGTLPDGVKVSVRTRHTFDSQLLEANQLLGPHDTDIDLTASALNGDVFVGVLDENVASRGYKAPTGGTYAFTVGTALATGAIQARINGGAWTTVIAATATSGNLGGVSVNDIIEVQHTESGADTTETFLQIDAPSSTTDAYAILVV